MPEIEEIDDAEAEQVTAEQEKKRKQDELDHAKALAEAERRRKVDDENQRQKAARQKRIEEQKKKTQELLNKLGNIELPDDEQDLLHTMPSQEAVKEDCGYEVFLSEEKGRGIRATKDFNVGNCILAADPFAFVIFESMAESVCHYCFNMVIRDKSGKPTATLMKCAACKFARYCSRDCQKKAWPQHKKQCMAIKRIAPRVANDEIRLVSEILWKKEKLGEERCKSETMCRVEELCDHLKDMKFEDVHKIDENSKEIGDYFGYENLPDDDEFIDHLFGVVACNGMSITDMRGLQHVGVAIHPTLNLINHHCNPNTIAVSCGPQIFVRAIKPIKKGDELFICYVDQGATSTDRKEALKEQYYFDCSCETCFTKDKDVLKTAYIMPEEDVPPKTVNFITKNTEIMLKKIESSKKVQAWERCAKQAGGLLMQQENLFDDTHLKKLAVLQTCSEVSAILSHYTDAAEYAERVLEAYKKIYPPISNQIGMQSYRLGVHLWHLQRVEDAIKMLGAALKLLEITHGTNHGMYKDGLDMINICLQERHMDKEALMRVRAARQRMGEGKDIDMERHMGHGPIQWKKNF